MDTKLISTGIKYSSLPESYVRPESERPNLSQVKDCENVPIIDLGCEDLTRIVQQIADACHQYGFFQVINHGISMETVDKMLQVAKEFFRLPMEEKMKLYSDDPAKTMRLSCSFNVKKEKLHNWREYLRLHCYPLDQYVPEWPSNPPSFKEIVSKYCREVRELGLRLEELIAESLGLEREHIRNVLGEQGQHMAVNFYPPCPEPELTYGLPGHTHPNALTILLQDFQVSGVLKDGKWMAVKPHPNAFVVNIGDQLQALSNGRYRSAWHNDTLNADKPEKLIEDGTSAINRDFTYAEYYSKFGSKNLDQEHWSNIPSSQQAIKRKGKQPMEGPSQQKKGKGIGSSADPFRITGVAELWAPKFAAVELGKQVTNADTSKDHETCLALGNAIMLPQDVADLAAEGAEEFMDLMIMQGVQILQRAVANSKRMKKYTTDLTKANQRAHVFENELKQAKLDLAAAEQVANHARNEAKVALAQMNKALQDLTELQKVASGEVFKLVFNHGYNRGYNRGHNRIAGLCPYISQEGWLACLKELGTPSCHSAWTAAAPLVELPDPPAVYSSIILPGFNEEEYANQLAEEEDGVVAHDSELAVGRGEGAGGAEGAEEGNLPKEKFVSVLFLNF